MIELDKISLRSICKKNVFRSDNIIKKQTPMFTPFFLFFEKKFRFIQLMFVMMLLCVQAGKAQDTIVKRNNEKVFGKILEVNPSDIKYKRFDYLEGPTFAVVKWELKYIVYGNGVKESFETYAVPSNDDQGKKDLTIQPTGKYYYFKNQKISEVNMLDIVWKLQNKKINSVITKTEETRFTKNCFFVGGITLATAGLLTSAGAFSPSNSRANSSTVGGSGSPRRAQRAQRMERQRIGGYMILGGVGCELVSVVFNIREKKYAHIVVDLYNKEVL
jgi:hypothetical protein